MVKRVIAAGLAGAIAIAAAPAIATPTSCAARLLPGPVPVGKREVTAQALVELRDFGRADSGLAGEAPFSVSPDGAWVAMAMRRADTDGDDYCIGIVLIALDGHASPRLLDTGGAFIAMTHDVRDAPAIVNGSPDPGTPLWSPDGRHLAYLRRDAGLTQVWTVGLDGKTATRLTHVPTGVTGFVWSSDGRTIMVATRPDLAAGQAAIEAEGRTGFLFDRRFWTLSDDRPRPALPIPTVMMTVDAMTGEPVAGRDRARVVPDDGRPAAAQLYAGSAGGARAWTAKTDPALLFGPAPLHVEIGGKPIACPEAICGDHVGGLWWIGRDELLIMRAGRPGNGGRTSLYRWRVGVSAPVRVLDTTDAVFGCQAVAAHLVCAHETMAHPRTLVTLDPATGTLRTIFDPNPDFAAMRLGKARRLVWTDSAGVSTYGDLVLPPDHRPGQRHPLVIVQYTSCGFLRGGTGDEYPIHLLAARGFAVLSFQRPELLPGTAAARNITDVQRINIPNWAERRMIFRALEAGTDAAIATGAVDYDRIGITGLSDGAVTVQFALGHSRRFKAAAISSCCDDPSGAGFVAGLGYRDALIASGYPPPEAPDQAFWRGYSLAVPGNQMRTPLLIQVPDGEYRLALETYSALQHQGATVEMYVFPDEHHVKWHPAHRLAVYERSLAWFDFWLRGKLPEDPRSLAEARRWQAIEGHAGQL